MLMPLFDSSNGVELIIKLPMSPQRSSRIYSSVHLYNLLDVNKIQQGGSSVVARFPTICHALCNDT